MQTGRRRHKGNNNNFIAYPFYVELDFGDTDKDTDTHIFGVTKIDKIRVHRYLWD